jgi:hypothetical protein
MHDHVALASLSEAWGEIQVSLAGPVVARAVSRLLLCRAGIVSLRGRVQLSAVLVAIVLLLIATLLTLAVVPFPAFLIVRELPRAQRRRTASLDHRRRARLGARSWR